jgi:type III secretion system chaperone SycN
MHLMDDTLAELAASFNLPGLAFNANGVVALRLGEQDLFSLEKTDNRNILLSLTRPLPPHRPGVALKTLRLCGEASALPMRAGLSKDDQLVLTTSLSERRFTLQEALRCLALLQEAHNTVCKQ